MDTNKLNQKNLTKWTKRTPQSGPKKSSKKSPKNTQKTWVRVWQHEPKQDVRPPIKSIGHIPMQGVCHYLWGLLIDQNKIDLKPPLKWTKKNPLKEEKKPKQHPMNIGSSK
jgi:hypothetical protein